MMAELVAEGAQKRAERRDFLTQLPFASIREMTEVPGS